MNLQKAELWTGGYYELAIELADTSDSGLLDALRLVWSQAEVIGPSADAVGLLPAGEQKPSIAWLSRMHLHGEVLLPMGMTAPCGTCIIREEGGPDWVDFYLPLGGLAEVLPAVGGYPLIDADYEYNEWQRQLDDWLADFGSRVFSKMTYRLALIGFEVSGECYASDIQSTGVPAHRHFGILWPEMGKIAYHPATARE